MERVRITDVSPRDGLQNEARPVPAADKAELVERLSTTGVDEIEVTSFVSAKWVPQLGDAADVLEILASVPHARPMLSALVPNERGWQALVEANRSASRMEVGWEASGTRALVRKASVFTAASETFNVKNTHATIAESLARFAPVIRGAHEQGLLVRGYVSCVIACPFEGAIKAAQVADVAARLADLGVDEVDLGDTIGAGLPETVGAMLEAVIQRLGREWLEERRPGERGLTLHLHDTFGAASSCVVEALARGVRSFDGSVGGLGGCPYASTPGRRAPGNISTETLVRTIKAAGFEVDVNEAALRGAAGFARSLVAPGTPDLPGTARPER